jgi:hypothetical protein
MKLCSKHIKTESPKGFRDWLVAWLREAIKTPHHNAKNAQTAAQRQYWPGNARACLFSRLREKVPRRSRGG